jgi:hypothetical protein
MLQVIVIRLGKDASIELNLQDARLGEAGEDTMCRRSLYRLAQ